MDVHLAELAVLYEITSFSFRGSEKELFRELVARTARLFGAGRVVLAPVCGEAGRSALYAWGFPGFSAGDEEGVLDYVRRNERSPGVYMRALGEKGGPGILFLERRRAFESHERRLLDILAGRVEELLRAYHREQRLVYLSTRDAVTGLYNRAYFEGELRRRQRERRFPISLMVCDLDGLKMVNDTLGHERGDDVLRRAAAVIAGSVRSSDIVARVGGDEFAVVLLQTNRAGAEDVARRIMQAVAEDNARHPGMPLGISVGTATAEGPERPLTELYREADDAMYRERLVRGVERRGAVVRLLKAALAERDAAAAARAERVKRLACALGAAVGLPQAEMTRLSILADTYEIGLLGLPEGSSPGRAPAAGDEPEAVRRRAEAGYRLALASVELAPVAELIRRQHAWWNGDGYPPGLAGEEIDVLDRILAIADAYDSLTGGRAPGAGLSRDDALAELRKAAGSRFDPRLVETLAQVLSKGSV